MIAHIDMDCFYASIEMRERPELRNKPLAVGGEGRRGVITTCNYPARAFGVRSAMPGYVARQACPKLIFLPVRFSLYQEESRKVFDLVEELCGELERSSVDEAYFRTSDDPREAWDFCSKLRARILECTGLRCSIGIAPNKMLAKIMSGYRKPDAQLLLRPAQVESFMQDLDVAKIHGVGPKSQDKFRVLGIRSCGDLQKLSADELAAKFGHWGLVLFERCRGIDPRSIQLSRERKSFSVERTLSLNISSEEALIEHMQSLYAEFSGRFFRKSINRDRIEKAFVRFKYSDFKKTSREELSAVFEYEVFERLAVEAYRRNPGDLRLIGLGVRFESLRSRPQDPRQLELWDLAG